MKASNMNRADFAMSIGLIAFGVTVLVMSIRMPRYEELNVNPYSVPGIVPGFLGAVVAFLGLILFIRSIIRKGYKLNITGKTIVAFFTDESTRRLLLTLAICLGYAFGLLNRMPYAVATIIYIFVFVVVFEYHRDDSRDIRIRKILIALLLAVVAGTATWATFRYGFLVNLPG